MICMNPAHIYFSFQAHHAIALPLATMLKLPGPPTVLKLLERELDAHGRVVGV